MKFYKVARCLTSFELLLVLRDDELFSVVLLVCDVRDVDCVSFNDVFCFEKKKTNDKMRKQNQQ